MECDGTVAVCCIELLADTAEDALLILDPPPAAVDVEFSESGVEELFEEDSKGVDDVVVECNGIVDVCCIVLLKDGPGDALWKLELPPSPPPSVA